MANRKYITFLSIGINFKLKKFQQGYYDQNDSHVTHDTSATTEMKKEDDLDLIGNINYNGIRI